MEWEEVEEGLVEVVMPPDVERMGKGLGYWLKG